jgi:hypothetical protein
MAPITHNSTPAKVGRPQSAYSRKYGVSRGKIVSSRAVRNLNSRQSATRFNEKFDGKGPIFDSVH